MRRGTARVGMEVLAPEGVFEEIPRLVGTLVRARVTKVQSRWQGQVNVVQVQRGEHAADVHVEHLTPPPDPEKESKP